MNLVIDIGNTRSKVAIFSNKKIVEQWTFDELKVSDIEKLLQIFPETDKCILSNVGKVNPEIILFIQKAIPEFIELSSNTPLPFTNLYESKSTQGSDRIAAIAGARVIFNNSDVLIIDAGTTITYDFINSSGEYNGGNISPGIDMRFKALHMFTQKLPLLNKKENNFFLGKNTNQAIESGVMNGIICEIEGYITTLQKEFKKLKVVITGGDCEFLAGKFKNIIFAELNLVMIGLNSILECNVNR